jgi:hypothetical protein
MHNRTSNTATKGQRANRHRLFLIANPCALNMLQLTENKRLHPVLIANPANVGVLLSLTPSKGADPHIRTTALIAPMPSRGLRSNVGS